MVTNLCFNFNDKLNIQIMNLTKTELVASIASDADISKSAAEKSLDSVVANITTALKKGQSVTLVGFGSFTGMVLALQMYEALKKFQSESLVGGIVALSLTKELAPVLTSLMVNSRAGSAIAAEIGSMRVTEQIDALESMAVNSVQYLITPRIVAGFIMLPILTIIADIVGVIGGYVIAVLLLGLDAGLYINKIIALVDIADILGGLLKAAVFGVVLTFIGCYFGYTTSGGAQGVGNATTKAVVTSAVMILATDYVITSFLLQI